MTNLGEQGFTDCPNLDFFNNMDLDNAKLDAKNQFDD